MPEPAEETKAAEDLRGKKTLPQPSRLGITGKLQGEWVCDEDVVIQGDFQGQIDAGDHDLHIEKEATVRANISGRNVTILGKVTGNVAASGQISVGKEAKMIGDLSAPQIVIQDGAQFKGTVKMLPKTT